MKKPSTMTYEKTGRVARITLNRPERGNGITLDMPVELAEHVERANLDPEVHVIALSGNGKGFCGGYDLVASAERMFQEGPAAHATPGSPLDPAVQIKNHDPAGVWDPVLDYQMMSRNVRGFMSLFYSDKPVICKVHGFCVAGGTDMALCSDLLVIEDDAKIGYPPARSPRRRCGSTGLVWRRRSDSCSPETACLARRPSRGASPPSRTPARPWTSGSRRSSIVWPGCL